MSRDRRAQVPIARSMLVNARCLFARARRSGDDPPPGPVWKQRSVRQPGSEVEIRRAVKDRRKRYGLPDLTHSHWADRRSPRFRRRTFCFKMIADERAGALLGGRETFRDKVFIR